MAEHNSIPSDLKEYLKFKTSTGVYPSMHVNTNVLADVFSDSVAVQPDQVTSQHHPVAMSQGICIFNWLYAIIQYFYSLVLCG